MKITILGSGLVGVPMAMDLAENSRFDVWIADNNPEALKRLQQHPSITAVYKDLSDPTDIQSLIADSDFVINALPGLMGYKTLEAVISAGKTTVDISFFPEDPIQLNDLAKKKNVTAVVDCGVAPGMSNLLVGYADSQLDKTENIKVYVGGLPQIREWPFEYKAVFSPADVLEEYIRPARYIQDGRIMTKPALSEVEYIYFDHVGTLEAFNTDGLRTLVTTIKAENMIEKTLRYPGHIELMKVFREAGFFNKKSIRVKGVDIIPFDVTAKILSADWKLKAEDRDITVMRVIVDGEQGGKRRRFTFELFDRFDEKTGVHSMARTTGYTATAVLRILADGHFSEKGIIPPERIGKIPACVDYMLKELEQRGVIYTQKLEGF